MKAKLNRLAHLISFVQMVNRSGPGSREHP